MTCSYPAPCCCCEKTCTVLSDNFDSGASTTLNGNWSEESGNWEIKNNKLSGDAGAVAVTVEGTDTIEPAMRVTVVIPDPQPGDVYRVLVNYFDENNYLYVEADFRASGVAYVRVGEMSDGAGSVLDANEIGYIAGQANSLVACRTLESLFAGTDASITTWACVEDNRGRKAGVQNASASATVEFDNFLFLRYEGLNGLGSDPDVESRCYYCECECDGHCLPKELTLTIDSGRFCSCFDNWTITLTLDRTYTDPVWVGSGTIGSWDGCSDSDTADFALLCFGGSSQFRLVSNIWPVVNGWTADSGYSGYVSGGTGAGYADPDTIQCDPLEITYTGFLQSGSPPPQDPTCEFTITITE